MELFRGKSIALSYDFGKNPIKGIKGIKSLSATVNFQNFITFSNQRGYNPEMVILNIHG